MERPDRQSPSTGIDLARRSIASTAPAMNRRPVAFDWRVFLNNLKFKYNLIFQNGATGWVENPYGQRLGKMTFFEHRLLIHPSRITCRIWRIGEASDHVFAAMSRHGHGCTPLIRMEAPRRGKAIRCLRPWMKRRPAIKAGIGQLKKLPWMGPGRPKSPGDDRTHAVLSAA